MFLVVFFLIIWDMGDWIEVLRYGGIVFVWGLWWRIYLCKSDGLVMFVEIMDVVCSLVLFEDWEDRNN